MVQSTVGDSILGALEGIAGISGRRAQDGLTAAQAQGVSLENKIKQRALDDDEEQRQFGELQAGGFISLSPDKKTFVVDGARLAAERPDLVEKLIGPEFNKFLSTKGADGKNQPLTFAGVRQIPSQMLAGDANGNPLAKMPAPANPRGQVLDNQLGPINLLNVPKPTVAAPEAPKAEPTNQFMVMVRTADGRVVPATQNASADPADPLITFGSDYLTKKLQARVNRMQAGGAAGNSATMQALGLDLQEQTTAAMQQAALNAGPGNITDDPVGQRELYDIVDELQGEDLQNFVRDAGLDPAQIQKEAADKWAADHKNVTSKIPVRTEDATIYQSNKELLSNQVARAEKAIADYDKQVSPLGSKKNIDDAMIAAAAAESGRIGRPSRMAEANKPKTDPTRDKLVAARDAAAKKLAELKPPAQKFVIKDVPPPKFEWTDDNLRESVKGKLDQPTPQQTAALTKYAKDQGIKTAADLRNVPRENAMALAWVISANTRGTPTEKAAVFDKLSRFAQTQDTNRSAIDANIDIANAQSNQASAGAAVQNASTNALNVEYDYRAAMTANNIDLMEVNRKINSDNRQVLKDYDDANKTIAPLLNNIYKGALTPDNKFNPNGPTSEAMAAFKELDSYTSKLPAGSPLRMAASSRYLEGFMTMAAAQASKPGAAAWWDWTKMFANTFLREDGMVDLSPLVEQARVKKWKNGLPEEITFAEGGARNGKPTSQTVGAAELSRYLGTSGMQTFVDSLYFQKAANVLGNEATPEAIAAKSMELKQADGYTPN